MNKLGSMIPASMEFHISNIAILDLMQIKKKKKEKEKKEKFRRQKKRLIAEKPFTHSICVHITH